MKILAIVILVLVLIAEAKVDSISGNLFKKFKHKYNKKYFTQFEEKQRFLAFKDNLVRAEWMNANTEDSAEYGITQFSDLTPEEFSAFYLNGGKKMDASSLDHLPVAHVDSNRASPDSFDWRTLGAVTDVKNQGQCGSCWAFSTTGNVEGRWFLSKKNLVSLSEQFLVDCDHDCTDNVCDEGCNGGLMWTAMQYIIDAHGIPSESAYPYEGFDAKCHNGSAVSTITKYERLGTNEEDIKNYLAANGPVSVALNANPLQSYIKGISDPLFCDPKALDHGVLLVGYGVENNKNFWIVKNSWGSKWGEKGFFRMIRGKGKCGINTACVSAVI